MNMIKFPGMMTEKLVPEMGGGWVKEWSFGSFCVRLSFRFTVCAISLDILLLFFFVPFCNISVEI